MTPIALALKSSDEKQEMKKHIEHIECDVNECFNGGICYQQIVNGKSEGSKKCKCKLGYSGEKCELLTVVNYAYEDSYIEFESPDFEYSFNLTFKITTESEYGILFYHGSTNKKHMAIELFMGRLRVSYDIGNNVISTMFSKAKINDSNFFIEF
jgi:slit protein 2